MIEVQSCPCVIAARQLSTVFPIPDRYTTEGSATSAGCGPTLGYLLIRCGYCGLILKAIEGFDFGSEITISPMPDSISI